MGNPTIRPQGWIVCRVVGGKGQGTGDEGLDLFMNNESEKLETHV